nr:uncharacterized protein LOC100176584 isoform X1 [Ciona intestinalis]|eukprot:XP_002127568.1 uncharacterized protein LOC100176584 isoform X1 [Ciona intestinalis]
MGIKSHRQSWFIWILYATITSMLVLITLAPPVLSFNTMKKSTTIRDENEASGLVTRFEEYVEPCGGVLFANINASSIPVPMLDEGETVECAWTIRSPHPSLIIGLAATQVVVNYYSPNNLEIDIYDGGLPDPNRKLAHWHGVHDFNKILSPITTTGDTMFINYTSTGDVEPMMELVFLYYICGGTIQNDMVIQSPVFNARSVYEMPDFLQCFWLLETPDTAFYGYLNIQNVKLPLVCDVLSLVALNGTLAVDIGSMDNDATTNTSTDGAILFTSEDNVLKKSSTSLKSNEKNKTSAGPNSIQICDSRVKAIAFSGRWAALTYSIQHPKPGEGFSIAYLQVRRMRLPRKKHTVPWYLNYAPVVIYLPLGILFGMAIIIAQRRRQVNVPSPRRCYPRGQRSEDVTDIEMSRVHSKGQQAPKKSSLRKGKIVRESDNNAKLECKESEVEAESLSFLTKMSKSKKKNKKVTFH